MREREAEEQDNEAIERDNNRGRFENRMTFVFLKQFFSITIDSSFGQFSIKNSSFM